MDREVKPLNINEAKGTEMKTKALVSSMPQPNTMHGNAGREKDLNRRGFIKRTAAIGGALGLAGITGRWIEAAALTTPVKEIKPPPIQKVRIGFVGVGGRGTDIVRNLLRLEGCQVVAVCDLLADRVERAQRMVEAKGFSKPEGFSRGDTDYRRLCESDSIDLVMTATPWNLHARICVAALNAGKHAATEVPAALTVEECWQMVEASEKANRHCSILENYCYFRECMCILNMLRQGILGEPMHVYAGYQKEAMYYSVNSDGSLTFAGEGKSTRMGNVYPTHHVGPPAQWYGVNRGDQFDYLVSMGNYARSFNIYGKEFFGANHPLATTKFDMTDISNTLIRLKSGRSIHLILDTISPRPYRYYYTLQATKGIYEHSQRKIHIQGRSPGGYTAQGKNAAERQWEPIDNYFPEFEHPLWKDLLETTKASGHGGGDYLCYYRLVNALRKGIWPDIDVYDTAAWSSIVELSEISARNKSKAMDFPDFTRGQWKTRPRLPLTGA